VVFDIEVGGDAADIAGGVGGLDGEAQFADDVAVRPLELHVVDAADVRDLFDAARVVGLPAGRVQGAGGDALDAAAGEQVLVQGAAVNDRGGLADVLGETERAPHAFDFRERLLEVALLAVAGAEALVPLAQPLHLPALAGREAVAVGVFVLPADVRRQPLVVHQFGRGSADAGLLVHLVGVERAPLGPVVDVVLLDHEAAVDADGLAVGVVRFE